MHVRNLFIIGKTTHTVHRQKNFKHQVIHSAANLFGLTVEEEERLANRAGLSFRTDENFSRYLNGILKLKSVSLKAIYEKAQVSERMLRYIRAGMTPSKETLLALAIVLELELDEINTLLLKAGYCLSTSLSFDMIVMFFLKNRQCNLSPQRLLTCINDLLFSLELPLLMTRVKNENMEK